MAQPIPYTRAFNFSNYQAVNPTTPLPAPQVDAEFNRIKQTTDETLANLKLIQRDDGALMNKTVGFDQLAPGLSIGFTLRGYWAAGASYSSGDGVVYADKFYRATVSNIASAGNHPGVSAATWEFLFSMSDMTLAGVPMQGYLYGLTLSNNVSDATNDIDIATGAAVNDTAPFAMTVLTSILTKRLDAAWAVGTGNGGRDTGAIADGTWHVWLIQRSDTGVVDALFSLSATAPTMPANYDRKRRIGSILRVAGSIVAFRQIEDEFLLEAPVLDVDVTTQGTTNVLRTLTVPTGIIVVAKLRVYALCASNWILLVASPQVPASAPTIGTGPLGTSYALANAGDIMTVDVRTSITGQVRTTSSTANTTVRIGTYGWIDTRGRLR